MSANATATEQVVKRPVNRRDMNKFQWTIHEMKRNWVAYLMLAPYYLIFLTFTTPTTQQTDGAPACGDGHH